jgi:hypothetical protein
MFLSHKYPIICPDARSISSRGEKIKRQQIYPTLNLSSQLVKTSTPTSGQTKTTYINTSQPTLRLQTIPISYFGYFYIHFLQFYNFTLFLKPYIFNDTFSILYDLYATYKCSAALFNLNSKLCNT